MKDLSKRISEKEIDSPKKIIEGSRIFKKKVFSRKELSEIYSELSKKGRIKIDGYILIKEGYLIPCPWPKLLKKTPVAGYSRLLKKIPS